MHPSDFSEFAIFEHFLLKLRYILVGSVIKTCDHHLPNVIVNLSTTEQRFMTNKQNKYSNHSNNVS